MAKKGIIFERIGSVRTVPARSLQKRSSKTNYFLFELNPHTAHFEIYTKKRFKNFLFELTFETSQQKKVQKRTLFKLNSRTAHFEITK